MRGGSGSLVAVALAMVTVSLIKAISVKSIVHAIDGASMASTGGSSLDGALSEDAHESVPPAGGKEGTDGDGEGASGSEVEEALEKVAREQPGISSGLAVAVEGREEGPAEADTGENQDGLAEGSKGGQDQVPSDAPGASPNGEIKIGSILQKIASRLKPDQVAAISDAIRNSDGAKGAIAAIREALGTGDARSQAVPDSAVPLTDALGENAPTDSTLPDVTLADVPPADATPADATPADATPADATPAGAKPPKEEPAKEAPLDLDTAHTDNQAVEKIKGLIEQYAAGKRGGAGLSEEAKALLLRAEPLEGGTLSRYYLGAPEIFY